MCNRRGWLRVYAGTNVKSGKRTTLQVPLLALCLTTMRLCDYEFTTMKKFTISTFISAFILAGVFALAVTAPAQPLPAMALKPVLEKLTDERPLWMAEAPDGSGRFFIVYQPGKILVVKKGSDGGNPKVFLDIESRHPYFQNEDGLLSLAFHPGFKTNGLFYIYYTQENSPAETKKFQNGLPTAFPYRVVVSEFKVSATDPDQADMSSERVLLTIPEPFWNHKGGELNFGPDG